MKKGDSENERSGDGYETSTLSGKSEVSSPLAEVVLEMTNETK